MLRLFGKKKTRAVLGLDIGSTNVKLLELGHTGEGYRVERYALGALPADAVVEENVQNVTGVAETIRGLLIQSGTRLETAAAAVTGASVITRTIAMPAGLSENDLEMSVILEAEQHIPYSLEEVAIDFEVQGPWPDNSDQVRVLLAACRRETLTDRVRAITGAGLRAGIMDLQVHAMERAFTLIHRQLPADKRKIVAVVDIGATMMTFRVLGGGQTLYTREQSFGGRQLTDEIMRRQGLSARAAGIAKKQGNLPQDYETELLEPFRAVAVQQIDRALQFFFSSSQFRAVDHIVLAGGTGSMAGLSELAQEKLGTPCTVANPFSNMVLSANVNPRALSADAPALMIACGLALRSFD